MKDMMYMVLLLLLVQGASEIHVDFMEAGIVACDDKLCKGIDWTGQSREQFCKLYKEFRVELVNLRSNSESDPSINTKLNELTLQLKSRFQKHCNSIVDKHIQKMVVYGLGYKDKCFFIKSTTVQDYFGIRQQHLINSINEAVRGSLKEHERRMESYIASEEYINSEMLNKYIANSADKSYSSLLDSLNIILDHQTITKVSFVLSTVRSDNSHLQGYLDNFSQFAVSGLLQKHGKVATKNRFSVSGLFLRYASIGIVQQVCGFLDSEISSINELDFKFQTSLIELYRLYSTAKVRNAKEDLDARLFFESFLAKDIAKYNNLVKNQLSSASFNRLRQVILQTEGLQRYLISTTNSSLEPKLLLTSEQVEAFETMNREFMRKRRTNLSIANIDGLQKGGSMKSYISDRLKYDREIYQTLLTKEQKAKWDSAIGKKVEDDIVEKIFISHQDKYKYKVNAK